MCVCVMAGWQIVRFLASLKIEQMLEVLRYYIGIVVSHYQQEPAPLPRTDKYGWRKCGEKQGRDENGYLNISQCTMEFDLASAPSNTLLSSL